MKDLVTVLFVLLLGGGGAAGFFYWKDQQARAAEVAYEQAIDEAMNRGIESFSLKPALDAVAPHEGAARLEALRALYADQAQGDLINMGFVHLRGDWPTTYAHVAELHTKQTERTRFVTELEERFGPGSYQLMSDQYQLFLDDMPRRAAEREAQTQREAEAFIRAMLLYRRRTGRDPPSGSCIRDGVIVENC